MATSQENRPKSCTKKNELKKIKKEPENCINNFKRIDEIYRFNFRILREVGMSSHPEPTFPPLEAYQHW